MAEYIERETTLQIVDYAKQRTIEHIVSESGAYELLSDTGKACYDGIITALDMCKRLIKEAVIAADVQPVKRGWWQLLKHEYGIKYYCCSVCNKNDVEKYNYCPHCGAKMTENE